MKSHSVEVPLLNPIYFLFYLFSRINKPGGEVAGLDSISADNRICVVIPYFFSSSLGFLEMESLSFCTAVKKKKKRMNKKFCSFLRYSLISFAINSTT